MKLSRVGDKIVSWIYKAIHFFMVLVYLPWTWVNFRKELERIWPLMTKSLGWGRRDLPFPNSKTSMSSLSSMATSLTARISGLQKAYQVSKYFERVLVSQEIDFFFLKWTIFPLESMMYKFLLGTF